MKRYVCFILTVMLLISSSSCVTKVEKSSLKSIDINELQSAMLKAAPSLPEMSTVNSDSEDAESLFAYLSDISYEKVSSFFLCYSNSSTADEIAVIKAKDKADSEDILQSLQTHLESRISLFSNYAPDEVMRLEEALIFNLEDYSVLIICDESTEVKGAFEDLVSKSK